MSANCDLCGCPYQLPPEAPPPYVALCNSCGSWGISPACRTSMESGRLETVPRIGGVQSLVWGLNLLGQFSNSGSPIALSQRVRDFRSADGAEATVECECFSLFLLGSISWEVLRPHQEGYAAVMGEAARTLLSANQSIGITLDFRPRYATREAEYLKCPPPHAKVAKPSEAVGFAFGKHITTLAGVEAPNNYLLAYALSQLALIHYRTLLALSPFVRELRSLLR